MEIIKQTIIQIWNSLVTHSNTPNGFISVAIPAIIALLGVSLTIYVFLEALIARNIEHDLLLDRLLMMVKRYNEKKLFRLIRLFVCIIILAGIMYLCVGYCIVRVKTKTGIYVIILICVFIELIGNIDFWFSSIQIKKTTLKLIHKEMPKVERDIKDLLCKMCNDKDKGRAEDEIVEKITDWYGRDDWEKVGFDKYSYQFSMIENFVNCHLMCGYEKLERDLHVQLELKFGKKLEEENFQIVNELHMDDEEQIESRKEVALYHWMDFMDHTCFAKVYTELVFYRDIVRYLLLNASEKAKSMKVDKNILIIFNLVMFKLFTYYLSNGSLQGHRQDYGKYKYTLFCNYTLSNSFLTYTKFENSVMSRCFFLDSTINDALFQDVLYSNVTCENVNMENSIYDNMSIRASRFTNCGMSFSSFKDCKILKSFFSRLAGENISFENVSFNEVDFSDITFREIQFVYSGQSTYQIENCQFRQVYFKGIKWDIKRNGIPLLPYRILKWSGFMGERDRLWKQIEENTILNIKGVLFDHSTIYESSELTKVDLTGGSLCDSDLDSCYISYSNLYGACFRHSRLIYAKMKALVMEECDLENANLYSSKWQFINFCDAVLKAVNATAARFFLVSFDLTNCERMVMDCTQNQLCSFDSTNLNYATMNKANFYKCKFTGTAMDKVILTESHYNKCKFMNVLLQNAKIQKGEFRKCCLEDVDCTSAHICETKFIGCRVQHVNFKNAYLRNVEIIDSCIHESDIKDIMSLNGVVLRNTVIVVGQKKQYIKYDKMNPEKIEAIIKRLRRVHTSFHT